MINEFHGGHKRVSRVNPQKAGRVEVLSDVYAGDYYDTLYGAPAAKAKTASGASTLSSSTSPLRILRGLAGWNSLRRGLIRVFLPEGYPNTVTEDLLPVALWDITQNICNHVVLTLTTRSLLLGVGVGEASANLASSTASWVLRDGVRLLSSIVFAAEVSSDLDCRSKTWRLIADIFNDLAHFLEVISGWFSPLLFLVAALSASVMQAIVGVAGASTRASFGQHFALVGNTAEVAAKAGTRLNIASLIGMVIGTAVTFIIPAKSVFATMLIFFAVSGVHIYANYHCVRSAILTHLNAPRLELCVQAYYDRLERQVAAHKKDLDKTKQGKNSKGGGGGDGSSASQSKCYSTYTPREANDAERLFILPAPTPLPPLGTSPVDDLHRRVRLFFPSMKVRIFFGVALSDVLSVRGGLTARAKNQITQQVEGALATCGVAMLFDDIRNEYHVVFAESFSKDGEPLSWIHFKRRAEALRSRPNHDGDDAAPGSTHTVGSGGVESSTAAARTGGEGPVIQSIAWRQLWAYFYAYSHQRACRFGERPARRSTALYDLAAAPPVPILPSLAESEALAEKAADDAAAAAAAAASPKPSTAGETPEAQKEADKEPESGDDTSTSSGSFSSREAHEEAGEKGGGGEESKTSAAAGGVPAALPRTSPPPVAKLDLFKRPEVPKRRGDDSNPTTPKVPPSAAEAAAAAAAETSASAGTTVLTVADEEREQSAERSVGDAVTPESGRTSPLHVTHTQSPRADKKTAPPARPPPVKSPRTADGKSAIAAAAAVTSSGAVTPPAVPSARGVAQRSRTNRKTDEGSPTPSSPSSPSPVASTCTPPDHVSIQPPQLPTHPPHPHHPHAQAEPQAGSALPKPSLHVITSLRADGRYDPDRQSCHPFMDVPVETEADELALLDEDVFLEDGLYPLFLGFVHALVRKGWKLDRVLLPNKGWTVVVHYV